MVAMVGQDLNSAHQAPRPMLLLLMVGVRDAQVVPSAPVQQAQLQTLVGGMERGTSCRISPGHFGKIEEENSFLSRGQGVTGLPQARRQVLGK